MIFWPEELPAPIFGAMYQLADPGPDPGPPLESETRSNMGASLPYSSKWRGGVLGSDGKIYGIPYSATDILIIQ